MAKCSCSLLWGLLISSLVMVAVQSQRSREELCRIEQLTASRPSQRMEAEGGATEIWDQRDEQMECAGVAAMRSVIRSQGLLLPNYLPTPRLVYIQQGRGLMSISYPGCPETYQSGEQSRESTGGRRAQEQETSRPEEHQKIHRIRRGDIIAVPPGVAHWCYNDGNEDLVAIIVDDLNNQLNQLDQSLRAFFLAGASPLRESRFSKPRHEQPREREGRSRNIIGAFDTRLIAQAFGVPEDLARRIQRKDERGHIVRVERGEMRMIRPEEEQEEEKEERGRKERRSRGTREDQNGLEETYCNVRVRQNLDRPREADIFSLQAGRLYSVNMNKLPILRLLGMSAEKGNLHPGAIYGPHWSMNAHSVVFVTRGEARLQVADDEGRTVFDDRVREGELVVIPQYFASTARAERDGVEWVAFKTSPLPMRSPVAGLGSVFMGMPVHVLASAYRMSTAQAREVKFNREHQMVLFPPTTGSSTSHQKP